MTRRPVTGNSDLIRELNRSVVLDMIRKHGPISRADVQRMTGLNFTTVTHAVADLVESGLVHETGLGASRGGRKPVMLSLNPKALYVLGCELQSTKLVTGIIDLHGEFVARIESEKSPRTSPDEVVDRIARSITEAVHAAGISREQIAGLGVAAPGPLDSEAGVLLTPPNMVDWKDVPLKRMLEDAVELPVVVEKDGNAAALGEVWFGIGRDVQNLVLIIVDDGVGAGIVLNGSLYRGSRSGAGEIGHTTIDLDGPRCSCGNFGCLEAIASGFALGKKAASLIRRGVQSTLAKASTVDNEISVKEILEHADKGDKLATDLLDECGRMLGIAIANTVNMYNPEMIVLAGRLAQKSPQVYRRATQLGKVRAFPVLADHVRIARSTLGPDFLVIGGAALILTRIFQGPVEMVPA